MTQATYIVLGANGGIGEALVKKLASDGKPVLATARDTNNINHLKSLGNVETASLDVTDTDAITNVISAADKGDGITGLAYCIGSINLKPLKGAKDEDYLQTFELNTLGAIRSLRVAEAGLKKAKGSVVLFSTIAAQNGFTNHSIISTAKGAIEGLTRSLAAEWAPHVRVNAIAPSLTDSAIAKPLTSSEAMAKSIAKMHPIPRLGEAEDSANLAAFLLNEGSGWITGQIMHVDGGRSALRVPA